MNSCYLDEFGSDGDTADERLSRALDRVEEGLSRCGGTCCGPDVGHCACICHLFPGIRMPRSRPIPTGRRFIGH